MSAEIIKLPFSVTRGAHSRKPRKSKNGTPEERAAKAAASASEGSVVSISHAEEVRSQIDRRKLRGSPLRDHVAAISFGATVVGNIHTAGLKGQPLATIEPEMRNEWLETLDGAVQALGEPWPPVSP